MLFFEATAVNKKWKSWKILGVKFVLMSGVWASWGMNLQKKKSFVLHWEFPTQSSTNMPGSILNDYLVQVIFHGDAGAVIQRLFWDMDLLKKSVDLHRKWLSVPSKRSLRSNLNASLVNFNFHRLLRVNTQINRYSYFHQASPY